MCLELDGKTVIVTGGSRGIGKATPRELALEGVDVVIAAGGKEALQATARRTRTRGSECNLRYPRYHTPGEIRRILASRARAQGTSPQEVERRLIESVSIRKGVDSQDIAAIVVFLASPRSVAINGDVIPATGGSSRAIYY